MAFVMTGVLAEDQPQVPLASAVSGNVCLVGLTCRNNLSQLAPAYPGWIIADIYFPDRGSYRPR
jgi:hypothetical protein